MNQPQQKNSDPINDDWWNETVVCIGGGPSLTQHDVDLIHGEARVIAINDAYRLAPWADILYACDNKWWRWWHKDTETFAGERWTQDIDAAQNYGINYIEGVPGIGLCTDPRKIHTGSNSGYQAINIAYHKGARRVILLGYDMQLTDDRAHWFGDHPDKSRTNYDMLIRGFEQIAEQAKIEVINCTRQTALRCFPRVPIEAILWI